MGKSDGGERESRKKKRDYGRERERERERERRAFLGLETGIECYI